MRMTHCSLSKMGLGGRLVGTRPQYQISKKRAVTPAKAGVQNALVGLDSGFRRNDESKILDT
jgi:hypothetical protein